MGQRAGLGRPLDELTYAGFALPGWRGRCHPRAVTLARHVLPAAARLAPALLVVLALLAPAARAATPVDGDYAAGNGVNPKLELTVSGGGTRISWTNSYLSLSDFCGWGGAWNAPTDPVPELPPIEIAPDGSFSTFGGPDHPFGVTATWEGSFTTPTTFNLTVVLSTCPFTEGSRTLTIGGALTRSADPTVIGPILPPGVGGGAGGSAAVVACTADQVDWPVATVPPRSEIKVGNATAVGCFADEGGGVHTTQLPARIGGFTVVPRGPGDGLRIDTDADTVTAIGGTQAVIDAGLGDAAVPPSWLPVRRRSVTLALPGAVTKLADIPVAPSLEVTWDPGGGGATLKAGVKWERAKPVAGRRIRVLAKGAEGSLTLHLTNLAGPDLDALSLKVSELNLPVPLPGGRTFVIPLRNVGAAFERLPEGRRWTFSGGWQTPWKRRNSSQHLVITLRFAWLSGQVAGFGADVDKLAYQLVRVPPVLLQRAGIDVATEPSFGFQLSGAVTLGPKLGDLSLLEGDPMTAGMGWYARQCPDSPVPPVRVAGTTTVPAAKVIGAEVKSTLAFCVPFSDAAQFPMPDHLDVTGTFTASLPAGSLAFSGDGGGWIAPGGFNLEANGDATVFRGLRTDASMLMSNRGIAVCVRRPRSPDAGFVYPWFAPPRPFAGCDLSPFRVERPAGGGTRQADARVVRVRPGTRGLAIRVGGPAGPPRVRVTGPDGREIASPATGEASDTGDALVAPVPESGQTFVLVGRPRAGAWTVQSLDGTPLGGVATARELPPVRARARVSGRTLRYRVSRRAGQRFELWDRGPQRATRLRRLRGGEGRIRLPRPTGGRHRIELVATRGGIAVLRTTLARYTVPRKAASGRVRGLTARRRGGRLIVRWRGDGGARYLVAVRLPSGRERTALRRGHRAALPVPRRGRLAVRVSAVAAAGAVGPPARRTVR